MADSKISQLTTLSPVDNSDYIAVVDVSANETKKATKADFKGDQGFQGSQGSQGVQGAQGPQGFQGNQGTQGNQGNQGNQGVQGTQGFQGSSGAGTGDVLGPASSTDNAAARFDSTGGKTIQNSNLIIDDNANVNLTLTAAVGEQKGFYYRNGTRFIHTYFGGSSVGNNLYMGTGTGNFTMSGSASFEGSYNTVFGVSSLTSVTTGYYNTVFGVSAGNSITSSNSNVLIGPFTGTQITTGGANIIIGAEAGQFSAGTSNSNIFIGRSAGRGVTGTSTSSFNVAIGYQAGLALTTGTGNNVLLGYAAGDIITTGSSNIIIGSGLDPSGATVSSELNIGGTLFGNLSNKTIGINLTDATAITAFLHLPASTTSFASLRIPSGTAPSSPNNGDVWYDGTNFLLRSTTSQTIATASNTISFTNKTVSDALTMAHISTPSSPSAGFCKFYFKSDFFPYLLTSGGVEAQLVTVSQSQTLTNKTLTAPTISTISNTGTLTLPTVTDTLVGRQTTDTFTNKTLTSTTNNVAAKSLHSATTVVDVVAATAPTTGQVLTATDSTHATWQTPSANKIACVYTDVTVSNTTSETNLISQSITGGILSTNNGLRVKLYISNLVNTSSDTVTLKLKYGSTTLITETITPGTSKSGVIEYLLLASGSTSSQEAISNILFSSVSLTASTALSQIYTVSTGTATENSSTNLTLSVTAQWNNASSSDIITMSSAFIEKIT